MALWGLALVPLRLARRVPWRWVLFTLGVILLAASVVFDFLTLRGASPDLARWRQFAGNVCVAVFVTLAWWKLAGASKWRKIAGDWERTCGKWQENSDGWKSMYRAHLRQCHGRDLDPGEGP